LGLTLEQSAAVILLYCGFGLTNKAQPYYILFIFIKKQGSGSGGRISISQPSAIPAR